MPVRRSFYNLVVDQLEPTVEFYARLFGLRASFVSDWFVLLTSPEQPWLELGFLRRDHPVVPSDAKSGAGGTLTFVVDDVEAAHRLAVQMAVEVIEAPRDLFYGQRRMLLRDPSGLVLDVSSACSPDPEWMKRVVRREDGSFEEV